MELQTQYLAEERASALADQHNNAGFAEPDLDIDPSQVAVLAIAPGPGLASALRSMGAARVISGGQSMNPSTAELVAGLESIPAEQIIILPNNPNILLAAHQAAKLTGKQVGVVPSRTVPQGLAALAALSPDATLDVNVRRMTRDLDHVRTVEVTNAVRDAVIDEITVRQGAAIAFVDERLVVAGPDLIEVATDALRLAGIETAELATVFTGEGVSEAEVTALQANLARIAPDAAVEIYDGGQPHYPFVIAIE
jgi:dihydroxyacetone kinase-like predicted kinase